MKRVLSHVVATTLLVGGTALIGCKDDRVARNDQPANTPGSSVNNSVDKAGNAVGNAVNATTREASNAKDAIVAGFSPSGASDMSGIRGAVEGIVQNAVNKNNWRQLTDHLTKADKQRLDGAKPETNDLDQAIDQFLTQWKSKYNNDTFTVMDSSTIYNDQFMTLASSQQSGQGQRGIATIPASHGLPELKVPLVAEGGKWRVDVPDTLDAKTLHDNLLSALNDLSAKQGDWPADKTEAYRFVTHRILMALNK